MCGPIDTILTGLLYGHRAKFLLIQIIGVLSVILWIYITMTIVFLIIKNTIGLRVSQEEIAGLGIKEHNLESSYTDFMHVINNIMTTTQNEQYQTITNIKISEINNNNSKITILPKIKVELIICKILVKKVINTAQKIIYKGNIGDGKIFTYNIENIIKVRTGKQGYTSR